MRSMCTGYGEDMQWEGGRGMKEMTRRCEGRGGHAEERGGADVDGRSRTC